MEKRTEKKNVRPNKIGERQKRATIQYRNAPTKNYHFETKLF